MPTDPQTDHLLPPRRPARTRWAIVTEVGAWIATAWPLAVAVALHACWLHAWTLLGHRPRVYLDDPRYVPGLGAWGLPTSVAFVAILPAALAALVLWPVRFAQRAAPRRRVALRCVAALGLAACGVALLVVDPWDVFRWWID